MSRYEVKQRVMDKGWVIWDSVLERFIGDGKGGMVTRAYRDQILDVVDDLRKRVGA